MHEGLVEEYADHEVELLFADGAGFVVFVHDEGDPLAGLVATLAGADEVLPVEG